MNTSSRSCGRKKPTAKEYRHTAPPDKDHSTLLPHCSTKYFINSLLVKKCGITLESCISLFSSAICCVARLVWVLSLQRVPQGFETWSCKIYPLTNGPLHRSLIATACKRGWTRVSRMQKTSQLWSASQTFFGSSTRWMQRPGHARHQRTPSSTRQSSRTGAHQGCKECCKQSCTTP